MSSQMKDPQMLCCVLGTGRTLALAVAEMRRRFDSRWSEDRWDYYYSIVSVDIESFREGLFRKAFVVKVFFERSPRKKP